jgi:BirA family transcriptional regulator, biotin operon repressor / biotin---[acetyl-CoA-carboxylase] ligase
MLLDQKRLTAALATCAIGHTLSYHHTIPSTMPIAHQLAIDPAIRTGTIVVAEEQSAGRGRLQRRWETPPGQALLVSVIFKPPLPVEATYFPMLAGLATLGGIATYLPPLAPYLGLKWPNDLLLGTSMTDAGKVGGILIESVYRGNEVAALIVGCGVNVLQDQTALPATPAGAPVATSIKHFCTTQPRLALDDFPIDRADLLIHICQQWEQIYTEPGLSAEKIHHQWSAHLWTLQQPVIVQTTAPDGKPWQFVGQAIAVAPDGRLVVESATGERHLFAAGDVSLRRA